MNADLPELPETEPLLRTAARCVWFQPPRKALRDTAKFAAYAFTYGNAADWAAVRAYVPDESLPAVLDAAPPGVFDARSWAYWNLIAGRDWRTCPPLPGRTFGV